MEFFEFQEVQALKWAAEFGANCILFSFHFFPFILLFDFALLYFISYSVFILSLMFG